jgi:hypothetical protein
MKVRVLCLAAGALIVVAAGACGDPLAPTSLCPPLPACENIFDTAGVYSISDGPESGPTGVDIWVPHAVISIAPNHFDLTFDIQGAQARVLPSKIVAACVYCGALQLTTALYDTITHAPTLGYSDSTSIDIQAGSVFWVQSFSYYCRAQTIVARKYAYAKFIVDSINYTPYDPIASPHGRSVYYRMVIDPNCGYTGLEQGVPPS